MVKTRKIRAGPKFIQVRDILRKNIEPGLGRKVTDGEITDGLADFLDGEDLIPHLVRRAKKRRGLFR